MAVQISCRWEYGDTEIRWIYWLTEQEEALPDEELRGLLQENLSPAENLNQQQTLEWISISAREDDRVAIPDEDEVLYNVTASLETVMLHLRRV